MKILLILVLSFLTGCSLIPLRPGHARIRTSDGFDSEIKQSENPKNSTTQKYEKVTESPAGVKTTEKTEVVIGAAQKDTGREIAAKLSSLKGVVWVGVLLFVFGAASAFYPPLKLLVGSVTTSAVIAVSGLALIILPSLIVGNEILILSVGVGAAGLYWFAHRHGKLRASDDLIKGKV